MPLEVHGGVKNPDDFQSLIAGSEKNDVAALGRDAAVGKQLLAETVTERDGAEGR